MKYEPNNIISRIEWCRLQQRLHSVTIDERAGWRAEEDGLVGALGLRDRIAFMREQHRSHFVRYQCGLEDGQALLRLSSLLSGDLTPMKGLNPPLLMPPVWMDRPPAQAPSRVHVGRASR